MRDSRRPAATSPNHGPGVDTETIAVAMPFWSITSSDWLGVHDSNWFAETEPWLKLVRSCSSLMYCGGRKW